VTDLFNRQIVGWAMGEHHDAALDMAIRRAHPKPRLIVHSDRGSEFANKTIHWVTINIRIPIQAHRTLRRALKRIQCGEHGQGAA
jgi:hypothetical protein